jgi:8-oxo-dGTP pyrophosphatase MutT (NUDIX family)
MLPPPSASVFLATLRTQLKQRQHKQLGGQQNRTLSCRKASIRAPSVDARLGDRRASVAIVLRQRSKCDSLEVLFIKRTVSARDTWSGDVAFPGGKMEDGETDLDTAIRETREEVGLDLTNGGFEFMGQLDDRVVNRTTTRRYVVSSFVFLEKPFINSKVSHCDHFTLQPSEISDAWWEDVDGLLRNPFVSHRIPASRAFPSLRHNTVLQVRCLFFLFLMPNDL